MHVSNTGVGPAESNHPQVSREQVVWYRLRASHLDAKLPPGAFADAALGGLQDSVPRGGVIASTPRRGHQPDSWKDPSLVQIWFRGGADDIVPRADVGVFTSGRPRDPAGRPHRPPRRRDPQRGSGETLTVANWRRGSPTATGSWSRSPGRTAASISLGREQHWLIPAERPDIDPEDARLELGRRFISWFGPTTKAALARWTGVSKEDATATWHALEPELVEVTISGGGAPQGESRFVLATALDALTGAKPVEGVRLIPFDDALTKLDKELLVPDRKNRELVFPPIGTSLG